MNKVILIGHLTADPEQRSAANGSHVVTVRLATNSYTGRKEDGSRREHTDYHRLVLFGRQAELAAELLTRGRLVLIEGRTQTSSWENEEGQRRYMTEVVVDRFELLGPRPAGVGGTQM